MAKTRVPPQPITKVNAERLLKKDLERKAQRAAARKQAKIQAKEAAKPAPTPQPVVDARRAADAANALQMAKVDAEATGVTLEEMLAEMGIDANGFPLVDPDAPRSAKERVVTESHPMYALVVARKHYTKAANGNQCNNDQLARALGGLNPPQVIEVLMAAMKYESNPYHHLNIGQQSMNLRNKARGMFKNGTLSFADVVAAVERASRHAA